MDMPTAQIGSMRMGAGQPLLVIAGPCVMESEAATLELAGQIRELLAGLPIHWVFKASFDKANRTSGHAFRGVGLDQGLKILQRVKDEVHVPVTTDIHESHQAAPVGTVCDLIQIPAFLARQTDLLLAAAATGRALHVKKGQFMAPHDMRYVVEKVRQAGNPNLLLCERGTFFGYGQLVNDFRGLIQMRELGVPIVFDATHSVQQPGGLGGATGGNRQFVAPLARAAAAVGIDGLFFETHPHPDRSPSDGPNMVPLHQAAALVHEVLAVRDAMQAATGWR